MLDRIDQRKEFPSPALIAHRGDLFDRARDLVLVGCDGIEDVVDRAEVVVPPGEGNAETPARWFWFEANFAGTSFISPISDYLGKFRYGPDFMNVRADRTEPGSLSGDGPPARSPPLARAPPWRDRGSP